MWTKCEATCLMQWHRRFTERLLSLLFLTKGYHGSKNCGRECRQADAEGKPIVQVYLESPVELRKENSGTNVLLQGPLYYDFSGKTEEEKDAVFNQLVANEIAPHFKIEAPTATSQPVPTPPRVIISAPDAELDLDSAGVELEVGSRSALSSPRAASPSSAPPTSLVPATPQTPQAARVSAAQSAPPILDPLSSAVLQLTQIVAMQQQQFAAQQHQLMLQQQEIQMLRYMVAHMLPLAEVPPAHRHIFVPPPALAESFGADSHIVTEMQQPLAENTTVAEPQPVAATQQEPIAQSPTPVAEQDTALDSPGSSSATQSQTGQSTPRGKRKGKK
eukprot:TRINITY_DN6315_c0_g1_i1.p1 TRINITY_DN6315_c0_g1~~TRINITY_DN6315_c0_g1_i1.p1  ORF type:complete len:332 (-),score=60.65 TRINITY_DN6315_c0_g1_i1:19-1014(-)